MTFPPLKQTLKYINRFGLGPGLQAARLHGGPGALVSIQLPGVGQPLWARTGTADAVTFDEVFLTRQYDLPVPGFEPQHIFDLGANVGYASVCFAARWPGARILALEPSAPNFSLLQRNTRAWPGIVALRGAVWSRPGSLRIANPGDAVNAFRVCEAVAEGTDHGDIPAFTVAQLMTLMGCERLDSAKMDVEGAEAEIFREIPAWLDRVSVLVIELHDRLVPACAEGLYHALAGRHFSQEIAGGNLVIDLRR